MTTTMTKRTSPHSANTLGRNTIRATRARDNLSARESRYYAQFDLVEAITPDARLDRGFRVDGRRTAPPPPSSSSPSPSLARS